VDALVDLGPGAEDNSLASDLAARIRQNLTEHPEKAADFRALRGTVFIALTDVGESITLRFDLGRLTIHEGQVGVPMVTFCGDTEDLRLLTDLPLMPWLRVPFALPFGRAKDGSRESLRHLAKLYANGRLKVYGLVAHPRAVTRLLRIISRH
jgi:hypothetical protein